MHLTTIFFDLDDTLYPHNTGLWECIRLRMTNYMNEQLGIPWEDIPTLRHRYLETYGTTLRGLQEEYAVDPVSYLAYVHDLPLSDFLHPDPQQREMLLSLPKRLWIFTNSDKNHANRVIHTLNIQDCFEGIIDIWAIGFLCKPDVRAYWKALELVHVTDPKQCVLVDDAPRNLLTAKGIGMTTVLVNGQKSVNNMDFTINALNELPATMPLLWDSGE